MLPNRGLLLAFRYCISFFATDATGESEFVMFEKVAAGAVGRQLMNLMRQRYPGYYTVDELANVARHDTAIPAEIERLVGHKIEETYKPELPPLAFAASSRSAGASSSTGGSGSRLLPLGPTLSHVQHRAATFGGSHSSGNATPPSPIASPGTPAKGSSAPKRGTKRSLFSSPPKRNTQLADACAAAAEEEPATLVQPVEDDGITTDVEKNGPPPNPKSKRNANSAKSGTLSKKAKP
nr:uncharacterized protein LOC127336157 [Lolium perenne]